MKSNVLPKLCVVFSPNASRISHLRKLYRLKSRYLTIGLCIGKPIYGEHRFFSSFKAFPTDSNYADVFQWVKTLSPDGAINLAEGTVALHAQICEGLGIPGPPLERIRQCRNKSDMRPFLQSLDIPCPRFTIVNGHDQHFDLPFDYPVIVKPLEGFGSAFVQRVDNASDCHAAIKQMLDNMLNHSALYNYKNESESAKKEGKFQVLIEEYLEGIVPYATLMPYRLGEISVESVNIRGAINVLAIHDSPVADKHSFFQKVMNSTPSRLSLDLQEKAIDYVTRIHRALGNDVPVLHTEFRVTRRGLVILEFGARLGGASIYRSVLQSTGNDLIDVLAAAALEQDYVVKMANALPTITHYTFGEEPGSIECWQGLPHLFALPNLVECQVYDDVGDVVSSGFCSTRASGYFMLQGGDYETLEKQTLTCLQNLKIRTKSQVT